MVDLGCQDPDWVDGHETDVSDVILLIYHGMGSYKSLWAFTKENMFILGAFLVGLGP